MENEIVKAKHVQPIQKNSKNFIYDLIMGACVKIAVLEICFEKNTKESVIEALLLYDLITLPNIF